MKKYLALKAWNLYLVGPVDWNVGKAAAMDAPDNVIYWTGVYWITTDDLGADHQFHRFMTNRIANGDVK